MHENSLEKVTLTQKNLHYRTSKSKAIHLTTSLSLAFLSVVLEEDIHGQNNAKNPVINDFSCLII